MLYYVDSYAGFLGSITNETTSHVSIQNVRGVHLDGEYVSSFREGLEKLTGATSPPLARS